MSLRLKVNGIEYHVAGFHDCKEGTFKVLGVFSETKNLSNLTSWFQSFYEPALLRLCVTKRVDMYYPPPPRVGAWTYADRMGSGTLIGR